MSKHYVGPKVVGYRAMDGTHHCVTCAQLLSATNTKYTFDRAIYDDEGEAKEFVCATCNKWQVYQVRINARGRLQWHLVGEWENKNVAVAVSEVLTNDIYTGAETILLKKVNDTFPLIYRNSRLVELPEVS